MFPLPLSLACLWLVVVLAACDRTEAPADPVVDEARPMATDEVGPVPARPAAATAILAATEGNAVNGSLRFEAMDGGVRITGQVVGLAPDSSHGFHVHETGDCSAPDGSSAGGHFNPADSKHGQVGSPPHHAGDSDNIVANADGVAVVDNRLEGATLGDGAPTDIDGKGVIVHAGQDDYSSQPTGDAGARLSCGVIEVAS
jgi:Cu-Zn family superoxide dismutase